MDVTVLVRRRPDSRSKGPVPGRRIRREEFTAHRGADPADIRAIEAYARECKLTVLKTDLEGRRVRLRGRVHDFARAFSPTLGTLRVGGRSVRVRTGSLWMPADLERIIVGIIGFDERTAGYHCGRAPSPLRSAPSGMRPAAAGGVPASELDPPEVGTLYGFPPKLDGSGQCIAIIALNDQDEFGQPTGGYRASVLKRYFRELGIRPIPRVEWVSVDGGRNRPGQNEEIDEEVMLDIEVAGALAPGARIAVYFAPNTIRGYLNAVKDAVLDKERKPSVISISWPSPERDWPAQARSAMDEALQDAAELGVTVCCASGNYGSSGHRNQVARRKAEVNFPASSPYALACGGTQLLEEGGRIASEIAWNSQVGKASGGGVSEVFPKPGYQRRARVPKSPAGTSGRGVPDVAAYADSGGYSIRLTNGEPEAIGGTSASAPLWAALIARINQGLARRRKPTAGWIHPVIYSSRVQSRAFRDIVKGDNDVARIGKSGKRYRARRGWDPCTGLGSPHGSRLARALGV